MVNDLRFIKQGFFWSIPPVTLNKTCKSTLTEIRRTGPRSHWQGVRVTFSSACALLRFGAKSKKKIKKCSFHTCTCCGRQERGDDKHQQQAGRPRAAFAGRTNHRHRQKCTNNPLSRIKLRAHHRARDDQQINSLSCRNSTLTKKSDLSGVTQSESAAAYMTQGWRERRRRSSKRGRTVCLGSGLPTEPAAAAAAPLAADVDSQPRRSAPAVSAHPASHFPPARPAKDQRAKENFTFSFAKWFYSWIYKSVLRVLFWLEFFI